MKFSERQGITKVKDIIQLKSMNDDLRNSLWNVFYIAVFGKFESDPLNEIIEIKHWPIIQKLWSDFFKLPIDEIPSRTASVIDKIKFYFIHSDWYEVYDFIEYFLKTLPPENYHLLKSGVDIVLKRECSAYRVINDEFVPLNDKEQIKSIQKTLDTTSKGKLNVVNTHIKTALSLLSDKTNPDYRNSIKESISALESLCIIISGKPKATLGNALSTIKLKIDLHASLEKSFNQLYGYTSDGDGIRHGMMDLPTLDQEDAIYMLISCSSFINYLIIKANKANIKFS